MSESSTMTKNYFSNQNENILIVFLSLLGDAMMPGSTVKEWAERPRGKKAQERGVLLWTTGAQSYLVPSKSLLHLWGLPLQPETRHAPWASNSPEQETQVLRGGSHCPQNGPLRLQVACGTDSGDRDRTPRAFATVCIRGHARDQVNTWWIQLNTVTYTKLIIVTFRQFH